jgi:hypothetical protein
MMIEPQANELPHEVEYALDVAADSCEIDAGTRIVLVVYGDRPMVTGIINGDPLDIGSITVPLSDASHRKITLDRRGKARACIAYADDLLAQLTPAHRIAAVGLAVSQVAHKVRDMAWTFSYWAITDSCEGGSLLPTSTRACGRTMCDGLWPQERPTPKTLRRIYGRNWIRHYIGSMPEAHDMRHLLTVAARRDCQDASPAERMDARTIFDRDYAEYRRRFDAASRRAWSAMLAKAPRNRQAAIGARKVAKRSAALAASVIGARDVSRFIQGEDVILEGAQVSLKVGKRANLLAGAKGAHALEVSVIDKDSRADLASLCVYIKDTPPLDQLAGFALGMQAGEELDILDAANVIQVTAAGAAHPVLAGRGSFRDEDNFPRTPLVLMKPKERRDREYWNSTKAMWIEELGTFVFGPAWRRMSNGAQQRPL